MWEISAQNPQGLKFFITTVILDVLSVLMFILRLCSRRLHKSQFDASDYSCLLAVILNVGLVVILFGVYSHGWGQDIRLFTLEDGYFAASAFVAIDIVWNAAAVAVRASMLLLYIRIFVVPWFQRLCWIILVINLCILASVILAAVLICKPITYSFVPITPGGHCGSMPSFELYGAISSLIADSIIVAVPMPMVWRLQMVKKKKVGLMFVFGMGTLICILTFIRIIISRYYELDNYTKQASIVGLITGLEPIIGVIASCLPFLPLIFDRIGKSAAVSRIFGVGSTTKKSNLNTRSSGIRANSSGQFRELDVQMSSLDTYGRTYISTSPDDGFDDDNVRANSKSIIVRKETIVESQLARV